MCPAVPGGRRTVTTEVDIPIVLAVDGDSDVLDPYERFLAGDHDLRTAGTGAEALDRVDASVDVVMFDRRLPDVPGDEVLGRIRERELGCRVALVTGATRTATSSTCGSTTTWSSR